LGKVSFAIKITPKISYKSTLSYMRHPFRK